MIGNRGFLVFLTVSLLGPTRVPAQPASGPSDVNPAAVSGSGTVLLKRRPDRMRVRVEVFARGKTLKEALSHLKDRREALATQLVTLGAVKDSISFDPPQVNTTLLEARKQMEAMIRARSGNPPSKKDPKKEAATPSVVSAVLTAEWSVKGESIEDALIEATQSQDAIKAADLAGIKEVEKSTSDDDEVREEMEGMPMDPNQNGQPQTGTPSFVFIATIPAADRTKAMADAFRKAREQAEATAQAAGATLGPLRHLESQAQSGLEFEATEGPNQAYYRMVQAAGGGASPAGNGLADGPASEGEARGSQPGLVTYRVTLTAAFAIK